MTPNSIKCFNSCRAAIHDLTKALQLIPCFELRISSFELPSVLFSLLPHRPDQFSDFRHFKANFLLDNFGQSDIGGTHVAGLDQGAAHCARAGVELADAPRNQVDQNVGIANFLQCFSCKFSVQGFFSKVFEPSQTKYRLDRRKQ